MNNPFDYTPDATTLHAFTQLSEKIELLKRSNCQADRNFARELEAGKMLGVLIAVDAENTLHTLFAFSGQIGCQGFHHDGFVEPVFDYLNPDGYFKSHEAEISRMNTDIATYSDSVLSPIKAEYEKLKLSLDNEVDIYRRYCRLSKLKRDATRAAGNVDEKLDKAMIARSQHEKAELKRMKDRAKARLLPAETRLKEASDTFNSLKERRKAASEALQQWLFDNFRLLNARGELRSLSEIFADTPLKIPPSGAGECCAPKLLQAAFQRGWSPMSIAEFWYGAPKEGEIRIHGEHYPACRGKCGPVLAWMLQGLDVQPPLGLENMVTATSEPKILFENSFFCVVDKPSGMLSVPGKGAQDSVEQWLSQHYSDGRFIKMAHRLDRDTSGLIIAAFSSESLKILQSLFATRQVDKCYIALISPGQASTSVPETGRIELPLSPDWFDRPRQRVDFENGKEAVTEYEIVEKCSTSWRVKLHPLTGRTHQLRLHMASPMGLGLPISGDPLYGKDRTPGKRLYLHAATISFTYPPTGHKYSFTSPTPF